MIVGLGLDVVELDRIAKAYARFGRRFTARILTPAEMRAMPSHPAPYLAARFAAKEAAAKALGTGFSQGVTPHALEIVPDRLNRPTLALHGEALERAEKLGATHNWVSITHGRDTAAAVVILERA